MKRSSKIIAVLLTALLIMGVFATAIFASDLTTMSTNNTPKLTVDGVDNQKSGNLQDSTYYANVADGGKASGSSAPFGVSTSYKTPNARFYGAAKAVTVGGNTYLRVYHDPADYTVDKGFTEGKPYNSATGSSGSTAYFTTGDYNGTVTAANNVAGIKDCAYLKNDFYVVDFDLSSDMYRSLKDNTLVDPSKLEAGADLSDYVLAYDLNQTFQIWNRCAQGSDANEFFKIKMVDGTPYIYHSDSESTAAPLSNVPGVWNHITLVVDIDNRIDYTYTLTEEDEEGNPVATTVKVTAGTVSDCIAKKGTVTKLYLSNSRLYAYLNGALFADVELTDATKFNGAAYIDATFNEAFRYNFGDVSRATVPIAFCLDNGTANRYGMNYKNSKEATAGTLANAFAGDNVPVTLGEINDIVYNYNYTMPAPNTTYAASVTSRGDNGKYTTAYYYTVVEALANLGKNDILSLADGVAINIKPTVSFYMVRNAGKTNVTYGNGYSELAIEGGYYVTNDQLIPNGAVRVEVPGFTKYDIWTTTSSLPTPNNDVFEANANFATAYYSNEYKTVNGNTYVLRRYAQTAPHPNTTLGGPYDGIKMGNGTYAYNTASDKTDTDGTKADFSLMHFDYVTVDFDFASDMYLDSEGKITDENTGKLAYLDGTYLGFLARASGTQYQSGWQSAKIVYSGGTWYLQKNTDTTVRIPISNNVGEWNHITYVFKINTVKGGTEAAPTYKFGTSKCYVYVNGEYFFETGWSSNTEMSATLAETYGFDSIRINYPHSADDTGEKNAAGKTIYDVSHATQFSMLFDNTSVNYYKQGYEGDLASFITSNPKNNISSCDDVVFDGEYKFESPNVSEANVTIKNEVLNIEKEYTFVENALVNLKENDTLKLNGAATLLNYVPSFAFDVICDEGEFTLADTVTDYVAVRTADGYLVRPTSDYTINVTLENGDAKETLEITVNDAVTGNGAAFNSGLVSEGDAGATYQKLLSWTWKYYALDGTLTETKSDVLTPEIINAILGNKENNNTATVTPEFENITVTAFAILDETGALVTDADGGYTVYNNIANIVDAASNAPSGATVVMHADFNYYHTSGNGIVVAAGKTLRIDLNGHKLIHMMGEKRQLIYMLDSKNADLAIYSSKAGGEIASVSYPAAFNALKYGYIVQAANADGAVVSFGAFDKDGDGVKEIPGNNLTIQTSILVECTSNRESTAPVYVVMDGGTYTGTSDGWAFITARYDVAVDIKNITYWSASQSFILGKTDYSYSGVTGTIDNSTIITPNLISDAPNTDITVTNSLLCGKIAPASGSVTLGAGVELGGTQSGLAYLDNCAKFDYAGTGTVKNIEVSYYSFVYTDGAADFEKSVKYTYTKNYTVNAIVKDITENVPDVVINWYGWDGTLLGTTNSYPGAKPSNIPNAPFYREDGNQFYYLEESDKWLLDGEAIDPADLTSGTYDLHANMIVPVIDIDESLILFNLTVANKFEKIVYVPYITGGDFLYNEVTYLLGGSKPNNQTLEGYASTIQDYPSAVAGVNAGGMWINATINGYESRQWVRMPSVPEYIEKVLEGNFDYYTKKLCVNMARYCDEIYDYTREYQIATSEDGTSSLLATSPYNAYCTGEYSQYLIDTTTKAFNEQIAQDAKSENLKNVIDYFDGATFYLGNTGIPRLAFVPKTLGEGETLPGGNKILGVYYAYNAFKGEDTASFALPMDLTGKQSNSANTGNYMNVNRNERIYFFANDLKITVYLKDAEGKESSVTGVYNLAGYIKGLENGGAVTDTSLDVAKAMYAYSMAAIEYLTTEEGAAAPNN